MADETTTSALTMCRNCGFEAANESDDWVSVDHPPLGNVTQCPECGSTDVVGR